MELQILLSWHHRYYSNHLQLPVMTPMISQQLYPTHRQQFSFPRSLNRCTNHKLSSAGQVTRFTLQFGQISSKLDKNRDFFTSYFSTFCLGRNSTNPGHFQFTFLKKKEKRLESVLKNSQICPICGQFNQLLSRS